MKLIRFTSGFTKYERPIMDSIIIKLWTDWERRGDDIRIFARKQGEKYFLYRDVKKRYDILECNYCALNINETGSAHSNTNWTAPKINAYQLGIIDDIDESELLTPHLNKKTGKIKLSNQMEYQ